MANIIILLFYFQFFYLFFIGLKPTIGHENDKKTRVLLISFDGFRWDYLTRLKELKPNGSISSLIKNGAIFNKNQGMYSTFATLTFPNHYTIATGLYQENHGIIANVVYDPSSRKLYDLKKDPERKLSFLYGGEPIWRSVTRKWPDKHPVGCFMWVGCQYGDLGDRFIQYSFNVSIEDRVNKVVTWFQSGASLVLLYFDEPDSTGHSAGPDTAETNMTLAKLDNNISYLLHNLHENHFNNVNLIFVSDHGMATIVGKVYVRENNQLFSIRINAGTFWHVDPKPGKLEETYQYLKNYQNLRVFKKQEIPDSWHYKNNDRISEILVLADPGYVLINDPKYPFTLNGTHGYSPESADMRGLFLAHGPAFYNTLENKDADTYSNMTTTDIYLLVCKILGLNPAPNNGSEARVTKILSPNFFS